MPRNTQRPAWIITPPRVAKHARHSRTSGVGLLARGALALAFILASGTSRAIADVTFTLDYNDPDGLFDPIRPLLDENILAGAHRWSDIIDGDGSLQIVINFTTSTRATARSITSSFAGTNGDFNVFHQGSAAEIIRGFDPNGSAPDLEINLNPDRFGPSGSTWLDPSPWTREGNQVPSNRRDAVTVFIHEVGHALAYSGWMNSSTGEYSGNFQSTFDRHRTWDGSNQFFEGPTAVQVNNGAIPLTFAGGAHTANDPPRPGGNLLGDIMNGEEFQNGRRYDISPINVATLLDVEFETKVGKTAETTINGVGFDIGWQGTVWNENTQAWTSQAAFAAAEFGSTTQFDFLGNTLAIASEATVVDSSSEIWTISIEATNGGELFDPVDDQRWQGWRIDELAAGEFNPSPNSGDGDPIDILNFINFDSPAAIGDWSLQDLEFLSGESVVFATDIGAKAESNGIYLNREFDAGGLTLVEPPASGASDLGITEIRFSIAVDTFFSQLPGDYNQDGAVDLADYEEWQLAFGSADFAADGNRDGIVDLADYTLWRDNYVASAAGALNATIPEPRAVALLGFCVLYGLSARRLL